jgi:hypothetical protein
MILLYLVQSYFRKVFARLERRGGLLYLQDVDVLDSTMPMILRGWVTCLLQVRIIAVNLLLQVRIVAVNPLLQVRIVAVNPLLQVRIIAVNPLLQVRIIAVKQVRHSFNLLATVPVPYVFVWSCFF